LGAENGLHTAFAARSTSSPEVFESGVKGHSQYTVFPAAIAARTLLVLRTCREHEDDVDVWMANQFIDRSDDMLIPKVSAADCAASRRWL